jgi:hypothetical protein
MSFMKIKTAIFTVNIGDDSDYFPAMLSAQFYAKKYNISYFACEEPTIRFLYPPFEKHQGFRLFNMGYDRILLLDRDILITPNAPNIFECCPDMDTLYAFDENFPNEMMNRDHIVNGIKEGIDWPKNERGMYKYFNSGVVIISKNYKDFIKGARDLPETPQMRKFPEQTSMNYMAFKKGIKFANLSWHWNKMDFGEPDPQNKRYEAYFIHYAGDMAFTPQESKGQTIRRDFIHFYGEEALRAGAAGPDYQTLPPESPKPTEESSKKCSIFFLCEPDCPIVNLYLRDFATQHLPADYELLLTKERFEHIEPAYLESLEKSLKIIVVIEKLSFDQSCIDIARQAQGKYVVFVHKPTGPQEILEAMRRLKESGMNIAVCKGGKYIIVDRQAFVKSKGFNDLLSKSERLVRL